VAGATVVPSASGEDPTGERSDYRWPAEVSIGNLLVDRHAVLGGLGAPRQDLEGGWFSLSCAGSELAERAVQRALRAVCEPLAVVERSAAPRSPKPVWAAVSCGVCQARMRTTVRVPPFRRRPQEPRLHLALRWTACAAETLRLTLLGRGLLPAVP